MSAEKIDRGETEDCVDHGGALMSRKTVSVSVDDKGNLHTVFSGFSDRTCETEEKRLRAVLAELGLDVRVVKTAPKQEDPKPSARMAGRQRMGS